MTIFAESVWEAAVPFTGMVSAWMDQVDISGDDAKRVGLYRELCNQSLSRRFHYQYDEFARWMYTNFTCISLPYDERFWKNGADIFLTTFYEESIAETRAARGRSPGSDCRSECAALGACPDLLRADLAEEALGIFEHSGINVFGECLCECKKKERRFVLGAEDNQLSFEHRPRVPSALNGQMSTSSPTRFQGGRYFEEQKSVTLTVRQYLELADWSLDMPNSLTAENFLPADGYEQYPLTRLTGLELTVNLDYRNFGATTTLPFQDSKTPICNVTVTARPAWTTRVMVDHPQIKDTRGQGITHTVYQYGIRFTFETEGKFKYTDPVSLAVYLASIIVYWQVPTYIAIIVSRYCLGALSNIFHKAQVTLLDVNELFCGVLCRALIAQRAYASMLTQGSDGDTLLGKAGSDDNTLAGKPKSLRSRASKWQSVVRKEVGTDAMVSHAAFDKEIHRLFWEDDRLTEAEVVHLRKAILTVLRDNNGRRKSVSRWKFIELCTSDETCSVNDLIALFDGDRRRGCIEKIFDDRGYLRHSTSCLSHALDELCVSSQLSAMSVFHKSHTVDSISGHLKHGISLLPHEDGEADDELQRRTESRATTVGASHSTVSSAGGRSSAEHNGAKHSGRHTERRESDDSDENSPHVRFGPAVSCSDDRSTELEVVKALSELCTLPCEAQGHYAAAPQKKAAEPESCGQSFDGEALPSLQEERSENTAEDTGTRPKLSDVSGAALLSPSAVGIDLSPGSAEKVPPLESNGACPKIRLGKSALPADMLEPMMGSAEESSAQASDKLGSRRRVKKIQSALPELASDGDDDAF